MPTVEFEFREFIDLLGREFRPDGLRERISMLGVDLENIDSEKIVMEIFPNRPDLLSVEGFSRAMKGVIEIETGLPVFEVMSSDFLLYIDPSVKSVRPCIAAGVIRNIYFDENRLKSLMYLQEKLHITHGRNRAKVAIGVHDLKNIKPPFTYKAVKPDEIKFIPLDMNKEMNLREILEKHPKGIQYGWVLENLKRYPIILDKNNNVLSFPPIINGELTRLTEKTRNIFIDVTGTSELAVNQALNILATSISYRGGKIHSVKLIKK
ncbi:MAG TPA: phenylalanine--tRNA ligase subunit beta [Candidatus Altiarchaeales archaeon]|nr:phenylalanine--tRNA ligase subunit beta [Candidatus Altiarchaeales archaeon]